MATTSLIPIILWTVAYVFLGGSLQLTAAMSMDYGTIVQEEKGIVLTAMGLLAEDANPILISTFLKIKDPSSDVFYCSGICKIDDDIIMGLIGHEDCDNLDDRTGEQNNALETILMQGPVEKATKDCFQLCLKQQSCKSFGVRPRKNGDIQCILRYKISEVTTYATDAKEYDMGCLVKDRQSFCQDHVSNMTKLILRENSLYVNETMESFRTMIKLLDTDHMRAKRGAVGAVLGGLGLVTSGFGLFETYQLKQHVEELQIKFEEFRNEIREFEEATVEFHENVLKMYKVLETRISKGLESVECNIRNLAYQLLFSRRLMEWRSFVDIISKDLTTGQLVGTVSPRLFSKTDVLTILERTNLKGTIYENDLGLFYRLTKSWVSRITRDGDMYNVHIVMSIPDIRNNKVYPMYKSESAGLINGSICTNMVLPEMVYQKHDNFYALRDPDNCQERGNMKLCLRKKGLLSSDPSEKVKCLTENHGECELFTERCETRNIQTTGGVMVRVINKLQATTNDSPSRYTTILDGPGTKFLNYSKYLEIAADDMLIKAIQEPTLVKEIPLENITKWESYLNGKYEEFQTTDINQLYDNLNLQKEALEKLDDHGIKFNTSKIMTIVNTGMWAIAICTLTGVGLACCCKVVKSQAKKQKDFEKVGDLELEEMKKTDTTESVTTDEIEETTGLPELRKRTSSTAKNKDREHIKFHKIDLGQKETAEDASK